MSSGVYVALALGCFVNIIAVIIRFVFIINNIIIIIILFAG